MTEPLPRKRRRLPSAAAAADTAVAAAADATPRSAARKRAPPAAKRPAAAPAEPPPGRQAGAAPKPAAKKRAPRKTAPGKKTAAQPAVAPTPALAASPPAATRLALVGDDARAVVWQCGDACPATLADAARARTDADGRIDPDDDDALPALLRVAAAAGHAIDVDPRIWPHLAARRDIRRRLARLQAAGDGTLAGLLRLPLAPYQIEGALWAVVAGRGLLADEAGLGKRVQAIAAARLWQRHFGLRRVLVVCAATRRRAWQRAWMRTAGIAAQMLGERSAAPAPAGELDVRITAPKPAAAGPGGAGASGAQLVIVDEPQHLALRREDWAAIDAPHALVLCSAALDAQPALLDTLIDWLDRDRLGPLAALREVGAARESVTVLPQAEIERLDAQLSRVLLQRQRSEVAEMLPARVYSERLLSLSPLQQGIHDRAMRAARTLLDGWRASGWLADADQWRLAGLLHAMRAACHRAEPVGSRSTWAEPTLAALTAQLDDWAADGVAPVAVCGMSAGEREALAAHLGERAGLFWVEAADAVPAAAAAVLAIGVPWDADAIADEAGSPRGRPWTLLVADDSIDAGLFETPALRRGVPAGPAEGRWLEGDALAAWLRAIDAALAAIAPAAAVTPPDPRAPGAA